MYLEFLNILPYIDLVSTLLGYISQYKVLSKTKCSDSISITKQVINAILLIFWTLYGIEYCTLSYILTCIISFIFTVIEIGMTIWFRSSVIEFRKKFKGDYHVKSEC